MDLEKAAIVISALFGGGGIVAFLKTRSEIRNSNKSTDLNALKQTIETLQQNNRELQDRYQEILRDNDERCKQLSDRLQYLEIEYVKQTQRSNENIRRIADLEIELRKANDKISILEEELRRKQVDIMKLEQENLELRKQSNRMTLLQP